MKSSVLLFLQPHIDLERNPEEINDIHQKWISAVSRD